MGPQHFTSLWYRDLACSQHLETVKVQFALRGKELLKAPCDPDTFCLAFGGAYQYLYDP